MPPVLPLAAALAAVPAAFDAPVSDSVLAAAVPGPAAYAGAAPSLAFGYAGGRAPIADQVDNWWANEGLLLIANALRPMAAPPVGLVLTPSADGTFRINYSATVTAETRP